MLTKDQIAKLLNRSLTTAEDTYFSLYLEIATQRLEELLCMSLSTTTGNRTYESRYGYRTVYVDPLTTVTTVTVDGNTVSASDYVLKQNDKFSGSWYNIIEFDRKQSGKLVVVDATWGFGTVPADLQLLLAKLFAQGSTEQTTDNLVKSKKIEDFTVTFKDTPTYDEFVLANAAIIDKYSQCDQGYIRHGDTRSQYYDFRPVRDY